MPQRRFTGSATVLRTAAQIQQLLSAAVTRGADPEQAREHFKGHPATDPLTRFLLARVDPYFKDESDLGLAVLLDLSEIGASILHQGADPNVCAKDGTTPLMDAAMHRNHQLVALLLNAGGRVNARNQSGSTPLGFAASNGADEAVRMLLKAGADFHEPGLLTAAAYRCSPDILKTLIGLGLDVNEDGGMPLVNAAAARNLENMRFLLDHGANPNSRAGNGRTPLVLATTDDNENLPGDSKIVQLLLQHGVNVNLKDSKGWTALMGAARDGDANILRLLLASGAEFNVADESGNTPLSLALQHDHIEIVQLLREKGARLHLSFGR